jgi:excisionase family DNA binding protein
MARRLAENRHRRLHAGFLMQIPLNCTQLLSIALEPPPVLSMPRLFRLLTAGLPFPHGSVTVGTSQLLEETRRDQMTQSEPWVSLEEISQHLGVSQDTIHRWIRKRNLPAHQIGRLWKFKVSEVDEWVRKGKPAEDAGKE